MPSHSEIKKARESHPSSPPELEQLADAGGIYGTTIANITTAAELYRNQSDLNVRIYNKIKHVFSIVEGQDWINPPPDPSKVAVLIDITSDGAFLAPFSMSEEEAIQEMANIRRVTAMGAEFLAACIGLNELGILF